MQPFQVDQNWFEERWLVPKKPRRIRKSRKVFNLAVISVVLVSLSLWGV